MNLNIDITAYLFSEGSVSLPGLGVLSISKIPAKRSPSKNKIYAPEFNVNFTDSIHEHDSNKNFIEFLSNKYNISNSKAEKEINSYSIKLLNNLANFNSAQIENLGEFSREKDKIQFNFSDNFNELLKESYPDFPILFIDRKTEQRKIEQPNRNTSINIAPTKVNKKEPGWLFPFITLTIISLLFVCFMYCISAIFNKNNTQNTVTKADLIETPVNKSPKQPDTKDTNTLNSATDANTLSSDDDMIEDNTKLSESRSISRRETLEKISIDKLIALGPNLKQDYNKSCIIIIGSFHRKSNSNRAVKMLLKNNFTPYVEKHNRFYRTGVVFDCDEKPLFEFLQELRETMEKDSWVLKYK